jgi:hypothetical protein
MAELCIGLSLETERTKKKQKKSACVCVCVCVWRKADRATGRQQGEKVSTVQNYNCCHCMYWSQSYGSAMRKEFSFRKKFPLPISSLSQVLHLFSFIHLCLSLCLSPSLFSHQIWFQFSCFVSSFSLSVRAVFLLCIFRVHYTRLNLHEWNTT